MADHRQDPPTWTMTLGNAGRLTTNNSHHGSTAQNTSPDTKTVSGNQWPHCKGNEWWGSQTITPIHHQQTTEPEIACLATPGMSQQQFGYYSSSCCPPTHKQYQCQSSTPTSKKWQPFGRRQQHLGGQLITLHHNTTCHSSTGNNISAGPAHTTNKDTSPNLSILPYIGRYNNNDTSQHPTSQTRHHTWDTDTDNRMGWCHTAVVPDITRSLQVSIPTTTYDHTNPSTTPPTYHHTAPSRRHTFAGVDHRLLTHRTATARTQLESAHRQQIHRDTDQNRTTTLQPTIHLEETTTGSSWHTLAIDGRWNCQRSTNGQDGRPIQSTQMVDTSISPTPTPPAHLQPQTIATLRPHHRPCLQHWTDRLWWQSQNHWLTQHTAATDQTAQQVWGHDHDGAYRHLPLDDPSLAYVLLLTPDGPTLWLHHVLLFGSAASVWSYNRFGDVLTSLSRVLTATPVVHLVDDYGSIQPKTHATSGFQAFGHLNSTLGFHMKTSKEQPPQHEHKIQGVYIHTDSTHVTIRLCQQRIQQITTTLKQAIDTNFLQPSLAQKLAGKCAFTATQLFGKVGRAANRALYDHAFSNRTHLDKPARQGILAMIDILQHAQPRIAPLVPNTFRPTIIYTDAYYQIDGVHKRCCELTEEDLQHAHKDLPNGWGIVVFSPDRSPIVTSGHVRTHFTSSPPPGPSYTSLKPGQPSSHQSYSNHSWPILTSNCATTRHQNMPLSRVQASTNHSTTSL